MNGWRQNQGPPGDPNEIVERTFLVSPGGDPDQDELLVRLTVFRMADRPPEYGWRAHAKLSSLELFRFYAATKEEAQRGLEERLGAFLDAAKGKLVGEGRAR